MDNAVRHLNERPYSSGYVAFEVEPTDDNNPSYVVPWLSLEDIDEANKDDVMMYSLIDGEQKRFALSEFDNNVTVDEFYTYMTATCGLSENKTINLLFGNETVKEYGDAFYNVFNTACLDYRQYLESIKEAYDAKSDELNVETPEIKQQIESEVENDLDAGEFTTPNVIEGENNHREADLDDGVTKTPGSESHTYPEV